MRKRILFFVVSAFIAGMIVQSGELHARRGYKKIVKGVGNTIFASRPIGLGKEHTVKLKTTFTSRQKIYSRAYFPGMVGRFSRGEKLHTDMWIDGKHKTRVVWKRAPKSSWKQTQNYIYRTGDDDFKKNPLKRLRRGTYKVMIVTSRTKYTGTEKVFKNGRWTRKKVYKMIYLSKGKFTYIKK